MGWLPCAPQLDHNHLQVARDAARSGQSAADYVVDGPQSGELDFAYADPDSPQNFPRAMFVWRSNLLGSSGKGHEYMMRHMLGTKHGLKGKRSEEHTSAPQSLMRTSYAQFSFQNKND